MRKHLTLICCSLLGWSLQAQAPLLVEHFNYDAGTNLQDNGWNAHSAGTTNPIKATDGGLSWSQTPYLGSGVGNAAAVNNSGSDENRALGGYVRSGAVYTGFLMRINGAVTTGNQGFFFHMGEYNDTANTTFTSVSTAFRARTYVVPGTTAASFRMGITFNSATPPATQGVDVSRDLDTGRTYLVVVKYQFIAGAANDSVSLYVFEDGANLSSEPAKADIGPVAGTQGDVNLMQYVALRQFNAGQRITVDGLIVRSNWDWLAESSAPVLLSPANNTSLNLDGPAGTPVSIRWSAARNISGSVVYQWQADARAAGTFNPAALALASDNSGADTVLSLTYGAIETALAGLGVQPGDTLKAVWRVRAIAGTDTLYSNVYNIDLVRKGNNTSMKQLDESRSFSIYPNPGKGDFVLQASAPATGTLSIQMVDAQGRVVLNQLGNAATPIRISIAHLPNGMYIVQIQTEAGGCAARRLILQK
ncbi:MAG: T9SS type A sorting domain-containing protein [Bacteroidota bacterium]